MPQRGGSCTPSRCFGVSAYTVAADPQIPGGSGRPDPRVARGAKAMYVECVVCRHHPTVKKILDKFEADQAGVPPPPRVERGHNYDAVTDLVTERVEKSHGAPVAVAHPSTPGAFPHSDTVRVDSPTRDPRSQIRMSERHRPITNNHDKKPAHSPQKGRQAMNYSATQSYSTAPTDIVRSAGGTDFAYRRVGNRGGIPLVLANYFSANLDAWDPLLVDGLADDRDVIAFDYAGIGRSSDVASPTVMSAAADCIGFVRALGLPIVDLLGFSLGGMVAQQMASTHPHMVRSLILCGTGPRGGEKMTFTELSSEERDDPIGVLLVAFFTASEASQAAGHAYIERINRRRTDRDAPVTPIAAEAQLQAIRAWGEVPATDRYATLQTISQPTLIVHGAKDVVVDPVNAFILAEHLSHATLLILPDASHGAQSQHANVFLANARIFLSSL